MAGNQDTLGRGNQDTLGRGSSSPRRKPLSNDTSPVSCTPFQVPVLIP